MSAMLTGSEQFVLLPGLDGTGALFTPLLDHLPGSPLVARYPPLAQGYDELVRQVAPILPAACVVVAESFSGPLGILLAARPEVRALVLVSSFARFPYARWVRGWVRPWLFRRVPVWALRWALGEGEGVARAIAGVPPEVLAFRVRELLRVDVREELRALTVPVLRLQGRDDRILRGAPEGVTLVPGPHLLLQRHARECAGIIGEWLGTAPQ